MKKKKKKECIAPFKYITISNLRHTVDTLYLKLVRASI